MGKEATIQCNGPVTVLNWELASKQLLLYEKFHPQVTYCEIKSPSEDLLWTLRTISFKITFFHRGIKWLPVQFVTQTYLTVHVYLTCSTASWKGSLFRKNQFHSSLFNLLLYLSNVKLHLNHFSSMHVYSLCVCLLCFCPVISNSLSEITISYPFCCLLSQRLSYK